MTPLFINIYELEICRPLKNNNKKASKFKICIQMCVHLLKLNNNIHFSETASITLWCIFFVNFFFFLLAPLHNLFNAFFALYAVYVFCRLKEKKKKKRRKNKCICCFFSYIHEKSYKTDNFIYLNIRYIGKCLNGMGDNIDDITHRHDFLFLFKEPCLL